MLLKTLFDASNLIRIKLWEEYDGNKSMVQYLNTKHGKDKVKSLCERYFKALGLEINIEYAKVDMLGNNELIIKISEVSNNEYEVIANGPVWFY